MATGAELTYQTNALALTMANAVFGDRLGGRIKVYGPTARRTLARQKTPVLINAGQQAA